MGTIDVYPPSWGDADCGAETLVRDWNTTGENLRITTAASREECSSEGQPTPASRGSQGLLRHWALHLLQQDPTGRDNLRGKHQIVGEGPNWLPAVLNLSPCSPNPL